MAQGLSVVIIAGGNTLLKMGYNVGYRDKKEPAQTQCLCGFLLAEREGFEPSMVLPIHEFQSCAINRARRSLHIGVNITPDELLL